VAAQASHVKEARALRKRVDAQEEEISDLQAKLSQANASLKAEVAAESAHAKETKSLKRRLEAQDDEISELQRRIARVNKSRSEEHDDEISSLQKKLSLANNSLSEAQAENKTLSTKLSEAQAENKTLSTKLAATRTSVAPESAKKSAAAIRMMGGAEVAAAAQVAQLKEDLYSDLTGLIIRNVKREEEEDVFDCIQTGRNGSKYHVCPNPRSASY
jgi:chromosome segregation ATPase